MIVVAIDVIDEAPSINYNRIQGDAIVPKHPKSGAMLSRRSIWDLGKRRYDSMEEGQ